MSLYRAALFDVDGVLVKPPKLFLTQYCEKYGVSEQNLIPFYSSPEFDQATLGNLSLAEAIEAHNDKWQWTGDINELIKQWLKAEDYPDSALVDAIQSVRSAGIPTYTATQQEKNRAAYIRDTMFPTQFDGFFASCDIGYHKYESEFWLAIIETLGLKPAEIIYFDDRQLCIDTAASVGIDAYLYEDEIQVLDLCINRLKD